MSVTASTSDGKNPEELHDVKEISETTRTARRSKASKIVFNTVWDEDFSKDVWNARRLGIPSTSLINIRFSEISRPWLKLLAKRWARWRLTTGMTMESARQGLSALEHLDKYLDAAGNQVHGTKDITREVIEGYLAFLHANVAGRAQHRILVGQFNTFLLTVRRFGWVTDLPNTAMIYTEDYPKETRKKPRALSEYVMAQIENPENLLRMTQRHHRLITLILINCGLRISDVVALTQDAVIKDKAGAPYLRYLNHKMKREAVVPIGTDLADKITEQIQRVRQNDTKGTDPLFPCLGHDIYNTGHIATHEYTKALRKWAKECNITDENGAPVTVSPHRFRHTLGTRLINSDVPQEIVRQILDHDSHQMTAHYARISDTTIRRHWEAARKVNASGELVSIDPDGPLTEAAWSKLRLGKATQALTDGYCSLPVQKSCPHANACLTCPMFVTTEEFLPQHKEHRTQLIQIISAAEARGQQRIAEMNSRVLNNLDKIITTLEPDSNQCSGLGKQT